MNQVKILGFVIFSKGFKEFVDAFTTGDKNEHISPTKCFCLGIIVMFKYILVFY